MYFFSVNDTNIGGDVGSLPPTARHVNVVKAGRGRVGGGGVAGMDKALSVGGRFLVCGLRELDQTAIKFLLYNSIILKRVAQMTLIERSFQ